MNLLSQYVLSELAKRRGLTIDRVTEIGSRTMMVVRNTGPSADVAARVEKFSEEVNRGRPKESAILVSEAD